LCDQLYWNLRAAETISSRTTLAERPRRAVGVGEGDKTSTRRGAHPVAAVDRGDIMGDGAEGLVDAQARIQDRLDELEQTRLRRNYVVKNPDLEQRLQSLRLARVDLQRQIDVAAHATRREQLSKAIAEIDRRISALTA
jgi:hypothetical protein